MPSECLQGIPSKSKAVTPSQAQTNIEVRDSQTGYLVPGRDGLGAWPDWESCWHAAVAVVVAIAVAVTWKFRLTFRPGNYFGSFQIGI